MMWYWIILIFWILVGFYDLYLYAMARTSTITQRIHAWVKKGPRFLRERYSKFLVEKYIRLLRIILTFFLLGFSWYLGGIQVFVPTLCGWLLCHLIGWDF